MNVKIRSSKVFERIKGQWIERPDLIAEEIVDINGNVIHREIKKLENWKENSMEKIEQGDIIRIIGSKGETVSDYINLIGKEYIVEAVKETYNNDGRKFLILKNCYLRPFLDNCELVRKRGQVMKSDLKPGDIVELRNKKRCVYIEGYKTSFGNTCKVLLNIEGGLVLNICDYNNDLLYTALSYNSFDVMKILDMSEVYKNPEWSMEREERKVEEMTLEEVCKELGREIKIVREK